MCQSPSGSALAFILELRIPNDRRAIARRKTRNKLRNKSGTEHPKTASNTVIQAPYKSLKGKDGVIVFVAHNPKVVSSNLTPATISRLVGRRPGLRPFAFLAASAMSPSGCFFLRPRFHRGAEGRQFKSDPPNHLETHRATDILSRSNNFAGKRMRL